MVRCVLFEMGEQVSKPRGLLIQAWDLVLKTFDYLKWKHQAVPSRGAEACGIGTTTVQGPVGDVNYKWSKGMVINTAGIAQMSLQN
jgi:hypothetical protein